MAFSKTLPWPVCSGIDYITQAPGETIYCHQPRRLALMGSTGSIGRNALDIIKKQKDYFSIIAMAGAKNIELLAQQALEFKPPYLAVVDEEAAEGLKKLLQGGYSPEIMTGVEGYANLASLDGMDWVLSAQSGSSGLVSTLAAAFAGKVIALANKESLVIAGALLRKICSKTGAAIIPVDSEHYAIFQCLSDTAKPVKKLILTASGGPFRGKKIEQIRSMGPQEALKHPKWKMGAKISIDSATLMNKGLEIIEAAHLYGIDLAKVHAIGHPQSIVHSLVEFMDNSLLAQMATPDMRLPIGAALTWPVTGKAYIPALDLLDASPLQFERLDEETFPCINLARAALLHSSSEQWRALGINPACLILNSANETAVNLFLENKIFFGDIPVIIEKILNAVLPQFENISDFPALTSTTAAGKALELTIWLAALDELIQQNVLKMAKSRTS